MASTAPTAHQKRLAQETSPTSCKISAIQSIGDRGTRPRWRKSKRSNEPIPLSGAMPQGDQFSYSREMSVLGRLRVVRCDAMIRRLSEAKRK
jgi:hypothetical protein